MRSFYIGLITISALAIGLQTIWVLTQNYPPELESLLSSAGMIFLTGTTAAFGFGIAADKKNPRPIRRAWLLIALAAVCNAVAEGIWLYNDLVLKIDPFPSLADGFYLLFYPLMLAGVASLPFAPLQQERRVLLALDMSIILILGGLFLWYFILAPMRQSGGNTVGDIVAFAYPVADLFILAGLLSLIQRDLQNVGRAVVTFLSASMVFMTVADVIFAVLQTYQIPFTFAPLNILWLASFWAMLFAAAVQKTDPLSGGIESFTPLLRNSLVYVAPILGLALMFISAVSLLRLDPRLYYTLIGVFVLAALVLVRQYMLLRNNRRMYEQMQKIAITDALTGLYNRHYFNETFQREIKRAARYAYPLTVLMMDIDNFKAYNDTHGHLKGDGLLQEIATHLREQVRSADLLARFGGDEFVLILPETDQVQAQGIADKLTASVANRYGKERLGMSVGVAQYQPGMTPQSLLAEADRHLYSLKR